jgi:hypothetical protein
MKLYDIDLDDALNEDIANLAASEIDGALAYDADGDVAGIVYYAYETQEWYAVDLSQCRDLIEFLRSPDSEIREEAYSHWCAATSMDGFESAEEAAASFL